MRVKSITAVVALVAIVFFALTAFAGNPAGPSTPPGSTYSYTLEDIYNRLHDGTPPVEGESLIGDVDGFLTTLEADGFAIKEVELVKMDLFALCDKGYIPDCFGNNAGAPYMAVLMDEEDMPVFGTFRLRPDEALVVVGNTPPEMRYFSYRSYVSQRYDRSGLAREREYALSTEKPVSFGPADVSPEPGYMRVFTSLGDTINNLSIRTTATPNGEGEDPFDSQMMIISTADAGIDSRIRAAAGLVGYPQEIINTDVLPSAVLKLGTGDTDDLLAFLHRMAAPVDQAALDEYMDNPPVRVFRLTPTEETALDPFQVPKMRVRGTGQTEMDLMPASEDLGQAILERYQAEGYTARELLTKPWLPETFESLQRSFNALGEVRDTAYLTSEAFALPDDPNVFAIAYGVDHTKTGKAAYSNVSVYGQQYVNGVAGDFTEAFAGSSQQYLPGHLQGDMLYAVKIARDCSGEQYCIEVPYDDERPCYTATLDGNVYVVFRSYLDPETMTGPNPVELILDRVIVFSR